MQQSRRCARHLRHHRRRMTGVTDRLLVLRRVVTGGVRRGLRRHLLLNAGLVQVAQVLALGAPALVVLTDDGGDVFAVDAEVFLEVARLAEASAAVVAHVRSFPCTIWLDQCAYARNTYTLYSTSCIKSKTNSVSLALVLASTFMYASWKIMNLQLNKNT